MNEACSIRHWPASERPRERLLAHGSSVLTDAELLAVLFGSGLSGRSAVEVARALLRHFGGLRQLLRASDEELLSCCGLGPARVACLRAALELSQRQLAQTLQRDSVMDSPAQASAYVRAWLRDERREIFAILLLDSRHRVIAVERIFSGTVDSAAVYPREVVYACLRHNGSAVILVHNHPSGHPEPSEADLSITAKLKRALATIDVRVLDHLVVGESEVVSLAQQGRL